MRKSKGQTIDLLYNNKEEQNKKKKNNVKKTSKKKKNKTKREQNDKEQRINLDNEIIIGLTLKKEETKKKEKDIKLKKKKNKKANNGNLKKRNDKKAKKNLQTSKKNAKIKNHNSKIKLKIIKWIVIIILFILAVLLFLLSSVFNIKQIVVVNNSKISSQEIITLSKLKIDTNMFKVTNKTIKNNIKTNAYIENVGIKRNINGTITLDIKERTSTYMLKLESSYAYINNQGYILETTELPLELPIISGFSTPDEEITAGNRLVVEDLNKLDDVIKIIEASKNTPLAEIITEIDITNSQDYKLKVTSEQKTISFGDTSNINIKLQMAGKIISSEKGKKGEIYYQNNAKKAVFKEEV